MLMFDLLLAIWLLMAMAFALGEDDRQLSTFLNILIWPLVLIEEAVVLLHRKRQLRREREAFRRTWEPQVNALKRRYSRLASQQR